MKRNLWLADLTDKHSPAYPCPECKTGTLTLVKNSLKSELTASSKVTIEIMGADEDSFKTIFMGWLKCGDPSCNQFVAIIGHGGLIRQTFWDEDSDPREDFVARYKPQFCLPMPDIFLLHEESPKTVNNQLRAAFRLFWSDESAAANRIRVALEKLMDHLKITKRIKDRHGKFNNLTLHQRIEIFSKSRASEGSKLMALKWLGNAASHQATISQNDLLDGFEILEHVLAELFEERSRRVDALTRNLIKKHAPPKRKKAITIPSAAPLP